jgi:hypothetical protein
VALTDDVREAGRQVVSASGAALQPALQQFFAQFVGWPYLVTNGRVVDETGMTTDDIPVVIHASAPNPSSGAIPADNVAAAIDAVDVLDESALRTSYKRIAAVKELKRTAAPKVASVTMTTPLGVVFAVTSKLSLEEVGEQLLGLNAEHHNGEWPDIVVVASTGAVNYLAQFPGEAPTGDLIVPGKGTIGSHPPPMYVVMAMRPTVEYSMNKLLAVVTAHLAIFSPGARLPDWQAIHEGVSKEAITTWGYWGSPDDRLVPVPRHIYNDRYLPRIPLRIGHQRGQLLSTIQLLPWEGGGVILLKGKLPLDGLLVFLRRDALGDSKIIRRPPDNQLSYALPITERDFREMLTNFQQRSNMVVRNEHAQMVLQKFADEGTSTPFVARLMLGLMRLRDAVFRPPEEREPFDKKLDFVLSALLSARSTGKDIIDTWNKHSLRVRSGEIARVNGPTIRIAESVDKELRRDVESFLNSSVRALKQGMQTLAAELGSDIGFLFKKQPAFEAGIAALRATDPSLADYLERVRAWSEPLLLARNAIEHEGWSLPRITYTANGAAVELQEPLIRAVPATEFIARTLDRLICFVEEVTAHGLQRRMPVGGVIRR